MVTAEMLAGVTTEVTNTITTCLPIGLGIFATVLGISFIPKIIKRLAR